MEWLKRCLQAIGGPVGGSVSPAQEQERGQEQASHGVRGDFAEKPKLIISNVPKYWSSKASEKWLKDGVRLKPGFKARKGPQKDFCIVTFETEEARADAQAALKGQEVKGKRIRVEEKRVNPRPREGGSNGDDTNGTRTVVEATSPWYGVHTYEEQLSLKQKEMNIKCCKKAADLVRKEYQHRSRGAKDHTAAPAFPAWLKQGIELREILPSPVTSHYRNKAEFTIGPDSEGQATVGFRVSRFSAGSAAVASPEDCPNIPDAMKSCAAALQGFIRTSSSFPAYSQVLNAGVWRQLMLRRSEFTGLMLAVVQVNLSGVQRENWMPEQVQLAQMLSAHRVSGLFVQEYAGVSSAPTDVGCELVWGSEELFEEVLGLKFRISPASFFQTNTRGAAVLFQTIVDSLQAEEGDTVLDVCCGTGAIGICAARLSSCNKVIGVELCGPAVQDAKKNAELNGVKNSEFIESRAEAVMDSLLRQCYGSSGRLIAVVDPPRDGLHANCVRAIRACAPVKRLIYVSCNPTVSLPRDLVLLCGPESNKYKGKAFRPVTAQPVDMFPHTPHCEMVMVLER